MAINKRQQPFRKPMFSADDSRYMSRALHLARKGSLSARPNPAVGCVLVNNQKIVGEGWHQRAGEPHAEVNALAQAAAAANGATAYVTLEPCSHTGRTGPCADALLKAGVSRVVAACEDPNPAVSGQGLQRLAKAGVSVASGLMAAEAEAINAGFMQRMRSGKPRIFSKIATSLDGRIAMASGESRWITGPEARADVQQLRAQACALVTGIGTLLADNPQLNVREKKWLQSIPAQPMRVVVDSQLRTPVGAKLLQTTGRVVVVYAHGEPAKQAALQQQGTELLHLPADNQQVDLPRLMAWLAQQQCNNVMIEAGAELNSALLSAGLIDELYWYQATCVMGADARPVFRLPQVQTMADKLSFTLIERRQLGDDQRLHLTIR